SYKGLDLLAEAWPTVVAERPDVRLLLVGAAHGSQPDLERLRRLPGVEIREGFVPDDDIDAWAAAADVLVLPYRHGAHSGVLHRGLAAATPVIGSPSLSEEIERTGAGATVPLDAQCWSQALVAALGADPLPAPTPPAGGATLAATLTVYRDVLDRRRSPGSRVGAGRRKRPVSTP
ncbi:MAG: glycosyltransferase, partial [Actinomycetota bacterium]|nr:glycosyltransferase [Actinomycetota bacterium]